MNLNMEGTKHEKAVLVILSYVVGFTAGFITFGLTAGSFAKNSPVAAVPIPLLLNEPPAASVPVDTTKKSPDIVSVPVDALDSTDQVLYKDGRLMANVNGATVLLSAQLATVDAETAKLFASQGVHEAIPKYVASPDASFIYYCEQHSPADSCINFVYDVNAQVIHYVTVDGTKLITPAATAATAIWTGTTLTIGKATSANPTTPWMLASAQ